MESGATVKILRYGGVKLLVEELWRYFNVRCDVDCLARVGDFSSYR